MHFTGEEEEARWKKMYEQAKDRLEKKRNTKNFLKGRWGKRPSKVSFNEISYF